MSSISDQRRARGGDDPGAYARVDGTGASLRSETESREEADRAQRERVKGAGGAGPVKAGERPAGADRSASDPAGAAGSGGSGGAEGSGDDAGGGRDGQTNTIADMVISFLELMEAELRTARLAIFRLGLSLGLLGVGAVLAVGGVALLMVALGLALTAWIGPAPAALVTAVVLLGAAGGLIWLAKNLAGK